MNQIFNFDTSSVSVFKFLFIGGFKEKLYARKMLDAIDTEPESRREWMLNIFGFCAKQHKRNEQYQIWTHENQAQIIYSNDFMDQKIRYIHENPVRAGIVERAEDYLYSSARNYAGLGGLIEILDIHSPIERTPLMRCLR